MYSILTRLDRIEDSIKSLSQPLYRAADVPEVSQDKTSVNVLSYNLSWASQQNVPLGSEKDFVERCQYLDRNCYDDAINQIAQIHKKERLDVVGIQECEDADMQDKLVYCAKLKHLSSYFRGGVWNPIVKKYVGIMVMWDPTIFGDIETASTINLSDAEGLKEDGRPCIIVRTKKGATFIVAHFPWLESLNDKKVIQEYLSKFINKDDHIIMMADTNDAENIYFS